MPSISRGFAARRAYDNWSLVAPVWHTRFFAVTSRAGIAWMALSALLFALMGVCVKFASARYGPGEIVFSRFRTLRSSPP